MFASPLFNCLILFVSPIVLSCSLLLSNDYLFYCHIYDTASLRYYLIFTSHIILFTPSVVLCLHLLLSYLMFASPIISFYVWLSYCIMFVSYCYVCFSYCLRFVPSNVLYWFFILSYFGQINVGLTYYLSVYV